MWASMLSRLEHAPSVQMQDIPPNIGAFLKDEEERLGEEQDGPAMAGERRSDRVSARYPNSYYEGEDDNDQDDAEYGTPAPKGRGGPGARRGTGRAGRPRGRGRGRGRGLVAAAVVSREATVGPGEDEETVSEEA